MGTKLTAKSFYLELEEVPTFSRLTSTGIEDNTANVFKFAEQYADHVSTSQKETIDRLRGMVDRMYQSMIQMEKDGMELYEDDLHLIEEAEQLLSTTEPIDQNPEQ